MKRYPLSFLCLCAIVTLSLYPFEESPLPDVQLADKWAHSLMYGGFSLIIWVEHMIAMRKNYRFHRALPLTFLCPILVGGLLELAQAYLTATRSGDWLDFLANDIGVLVVSALFGVYSMSRHTL